MGVSGVAVFGEQGGDWLALFKGLVQKAPGPLLTSYLHEATLTIRREIVLDAKVAKSVKWRFTTANDLVYHIESSQSECPLAVRYAVICLSQLGHVLEWVTHEDVEQH